LGQLLFVAPPQTYFPATARKLQRQRRSPGTGADDSLCAQRTY